MNMKEKFKPLGKARLKCFKNNSPPKSDFYNTSSSSPKSDKVNASSASDSDGDLYKSLLNDVPSTSNEKGTMTDSSLQKKCKQLVKKSQLAATTYSNLNNILQSISKNKADNKVPLVILSKSPPVTKSSEIKKAMQMGAGKMNVFDFISSELDSSENETDEDDTGNEKDTNQNSLNLSDSSISMDDMNLSGSTVSMSPDFTGFSSPLKNPQHFSNIKTSKNNDKVCKKFQSKLDKEIISPETEVAATSLDHPYSNGSQQKSRSSHPSPETPLAGNEYQRIVNRSVFGSPLSKNPPDIMLHNDKINILRQMSQVFNDEKAVKAKLSKLPNSSKENQNKIKGISENGSINSKVTTGTETKTTKTLTTATIGSTKTTKNVTTTATIGSTKSTKNVATIGSTKTTKNVTTTATIGSTTTTKNVTTTTATDTKTTKTISTTAATTAVLTVTTSTANTLAQPVESIPAKKSISPDANVGKETDCVDGRSKNNKENIVRKKYMTRKSSKLDQPPSTEIPEEETPEENTPVHLVSSYAVNRDESIKVQSYSGSKGEDVDIINGFTFFSFETESEMMKYVPAKSKRKLRKRKISTSKVSKVSEQITENFDFQSEDDKKSADDSNSVPVMERNENLSEQVTPTTEPIKESKATEKIVEPSAFASNDLEQYLTEHSELKISFAIPKCRATEEGVTKFDETGKPIPHSESSTTSKVEKKSVLGSRIVNSIPGKSTVPSIPVVKTSATSKLPSVSLPKEVESINLLTSKGRKPLSSQGSKDLFVKRGGNLLPLSSVFKRATSEDEIVKDSNLEMIYVYHRGRLLTLGGSLTKVNPSNSNSIKAKVALPRGHNRLVKHAQRVSFRKVKAVEINEDLAKFALSALKMPTNSDLDSKPERAKEEPKGYVKPSKENILDILAAKFSIDKDSKWDASTDASKGSSTDSSKSHLNENCEDTESGSCIPKKSDVVSKIKWNQDDILKKKDSTSSLEQSKGFKKNINRFPSLSREMKRLNMNFVTYKESDDEKEENIVEKPMDPCTNEHCTMGCVCESLRCRKKTVEHCGKVDCMFKCCCTLESWKEGGSKVTTEKPVNIVSIFNADRENDHLALKEKDFKKTIVQTGSDVYFVGGEKKKRDIRIPQRYRDTNVWKSSNNSYSIYDNIEEDKANKENVPILPSSYKHYIKDFSLNVPWYDLNGASIWCMYHSCYDCSCLTDQSFYMGTTQEVSECEEEDVVIVENSEQNDEENYMPKSLHDNRMMCFNLKLNPGRGNASPYKGKWTFKHYIHNCNFHCARTSGYDIKERITKDLSQQNMKEGYSLPLTKAPFIMGITLKNKIEDERQRNSDQNSKGIPRLKSVFHDGLGPGLTLSNITSTDEIFSKYSGNLHLSNICLKSCEGPAVKGNDLISSKKEGPTILEGEQNFAEEDSKADAENPRTKTSISKSSSNEILELNGKDDTKKCFSLYDMIKEEEKRGELELDLSPKEEGKAILITESRFRKLINMNIIGIIGLNKSGRCIISTVKSSDDLIKMQRLQQLISNNTIDVGPNMKEIFTPSSQLDQKIRYVMIRCDISGRWEIVGVVQRKSKENENFVPPKPKRQKTKQALPSIIMNHVKFKPNSSSIGTEVAGEGNDVEHNQDSNNTTDTCTSNTDASESDTDTVLLKGNNVMTKIDIGSRGKSSNRAIPNETSSTNSNKLDDLIIEEGEYDMSLPCISSVVSGDDPSINELIGSPPEPSSPKQNETEFSKSYRPIIPASKNYILNQPSGKIFGAKKLISTGECSGVAPNLKMTKSNPGNFFPGILKFQPKIAHSKLLLFPKLVSPGNQIRPNVPVINSHQMPANRPQLFINSSQVHPQVQPNSSVIRAKVPQILSPGVKPTISVPDNTNTVGNDKIKMLLLPSSTSPGKSILIPTVNNVPVNYSWVVRGQNESIKSSCGVVSQVVPFNFNANSKSKINIPLSFTTAAAKQVPQVQTTSSRISMLPIVSSQIIPSMTQKNNISVKSIPTDNVTVLNSPVKSNILTNKNTSLDGSCSLIDVEKISSPTSLSKCAAASSSLLEQYSSSEKVNVGSLPTVTNSVVPKTYILSQSSSTIQTKTEPVDHSCLTTLEDLKCNTDSDDTQLGSSPDVKCLTVQRYENCTAVDLLVKFKSIKIHWLSGTIKKGVLLNIFQKSRKNNAPVSLTANNDTIRRSSFVGMYHFALIGGHLFPVLILGTKLSSVLATTKLNSQELFRKNTVKYLIKEESGELSSYTYDAKGLNLVRIASKRKEVGVQVLGRGEKFPVEQLREQVNEVDFIPNVRQASLPKTVEDEIVISDSEDESESKTDKNLQVSSASTVPVRLSRPLPVSPLIKEDKIVVTSKASFIKSANLSPFATMPSDLKRKYDEVDSGSSVSKDSEKQTHFDKVKKFKNKFFTSSPGDILKKGKLAQMTRCKPVLKIPNPFQSPKIQESRTKDTQYSDPEDEVQLIMDETSSLNDKDLPGSDKLSNNTKTLQTLLIETINDMTKAFNSSFQTDKIFPSKKQPSWGLGAINTDISKKRRPNFIIPLSKKKKSLEKTNSEYEEDPLKIEHMAARLNSNDITQSSFTKMPLNLNLNRGSQLINTPSTSDEQTFSLSLDPSTDDSNFGKSLQEDPLDSEVGVEEPSTASLATQLSDAHHSLVGNSEKPCPLSKKSFSKRNRHANSTPSTPDHSSTFPVNYKSKSCSPLPKKNSPIGNRNSVLSSPTSQEFQQVFSGAPQFWLMDNTEKHNTLERIRRKGLAKMLENLYSKATEVPTGNARLPPKHVILKESEKVIYELRTKDLKLAKTEIGLREKKSNLLNSLSDILKDCDEDMQKQFELWISSNISNPTAKNKFEDSWKPQNVVFEDEQIYSNTCGQLTVSGTDITSYFATHTAGFTPTKSPPKFKAVKSQLSRRKFPFTANSNPLSKYAHHSQTLKNKLTNVLKQKKLFTFAQSLSHSTSPESLSDSKEVFSKDVDSDSRWIDLVSPPRSESSVKRISSDDDSISNSSNSNNSSNSVKESGKSIMFGDEKDASEPNETSNSNESLINKADNNGLSVRSLSDR